MADYNEAIRINPRYATAFNNRGRLYQAMGDVERSLADYEEARRLEPDNPAYHGFGMRR
jgi:tetratricopeptide (TPR) repeat protein